MGSFVKRVSVLGACALLLLGCGSGEDEGGSGGGGGSRPNLDELYPPPAEGEGFQMAMDTMAPAGEEIWKCVVYDLDTSVFENVNHVESWQSEGMHHMDVMALAFTGITIKPGVYECDDLYQKHRELMEDGLIIYAAQDTYQQIQLPEGTVAALPPALTVMHEIHYLNTTTEDKPVFSRVNAYTIPRSEVKEQIWGAAVRDTHLNIPPRQKHTEWTRCVMNDDVDLLLLSSHTHQLGREVTINLFDGKNVGEKIYTNTEWETPFLKSFDTQPLHIEKGTGFEFSCQFDNTSDEMVNWGFSAADEMCQIAIVFTPGESDRVCEVVESSDGVLE